MLIVCPTCATTYQVDMAALGSGRSVRCSQCRNTWFATADNFLVEVAYAAAPEPSHPALPTPPRPPEPPVDDLPGMTSNPFATPLRDPGTALAVVNAPPLAPWEVPATPAEPAAERFEPGVPDDTETVAARRARQTHLERSERRSGWRRIASLPMLIATLLAILGAALQWRIAVVRHVPQTAALYSAIGLPVNLRGLIFENVKSSGEFQDGVTVLIVEGTIANLTGKTHDVPRLRFTLRNAAGLEVYAWTALPSKTSLAPGAELPFRTRLASPPPDGRDVIVRFFNRRDVVAGAP